MIVMTVMPMMIVTTVMTVMPVMIVTTVMTVMHYCRYLDLWIECSSHALLC